MRYEVQTFRLVPEEERSSVSTGSPLQILEWKSFATIEAAESFVEKERRNPKVFKIVMNDMHLGVALLLVWTQASTEWPQLKDIDTRSHWKNVQREDIKWEYLWGF